MALEGRSKVYVSGSRHYVYVPATVVKDSQFPFRVGKDGDVLVVRIEGEHLVVERAPKAEAPPGSKRRGGGRGA